MSLHVSIKIKDTIKDCTLLLGSESITCIIFDWYLLFNEVWYGMVIIYLT